MVSLNTIMVEVVDLSRVKLGGFNWDKGNIDKNLLKHKVTNEESEQVFYNQPLLVFEDKKHSWKEKRLVAYGITDEGRKLTVVFTIRGNLIRVISARNQNIKERRVYEKNKNHSQI